MSLRSPKSVSSRCLLSRALEEDMQNDDERELLVEYHNLLKQVGAEQNKLSNSEGKNTANIAKQIDKLDRKLLELENTPVLQNVLKREKEKTRQIESQRAKEWLAEYRRNAAAHYQEVIKKNEEARQEALKKREENHTIESHYRLIDNLLYKEKSLRETVTKDNSKYRQTEMDKLIKTRWILFAMWAIGIVVFTTIIYFMFSCDTILIPLIISTVVISPIVMYLLSSTTEERITAIHSYGKIKEIQTERDIVKMYTELLHNVDIYEFLGIPSDIKFDAHDLPYHDGANADSQRPYGSLTRYIAPSSGTRYHIKQGCSGAHSPIHGYELSLNEYRKAWRYYSPCNVCIGSRDSISVPQWYVYYLKVVKITNHYDIKANYRK